jgi:hypothetical protein
MGMEVLQIDGVEYNLPFYLQVGESIFLPGLAHQRMFRAVIQFYKPRNIKLVYRQWVDCGALGIRVWRVVD